MRVVDQQRKSGNGYPAERHGLRKVCGEIKMKSVLISIHPKRCELIANGEKTIEVRKTRPKIETPFKCYIYCTQSGKYKNGKSVKNIWLNRGTDRRFIGNGKVIGEFACNRIDPIKAVRRDGGSAERSWKSIFTFMPSKRHNVLLNATGMETEEIYDYLGGEGKWGYAWHISDLKIYDKPRELSEFGRGCDAEHINEIRCRDCKKLVSFEDCCEVMCKPLNRPPQSWCYVEDLDGLRADDSQNVERRRHGDRHDRWIARCVLRHCFV